MPTLCWRRPLQGAQYGSLFSCALLLHAHTLIVDNVDLPLQDGNEEGTWKLRTLAGAVLLIAHGMARRWMSHHHIARLVLVALVICVLPRPFLPFLPVVIALCLLDIVMTMSSHSLRLQKCHILVVVERSQQDMWSNEGNQVGYIKPIELQIVVTMISRHGRRSGRLAS